MGSSIIQRMIDKDEAPPKYRSKAWRKLIAAIEKEKGQKICGGKRRNNRKPRMNGFPCEAKPIAGRNNCKKHGGHTPAPGPGHHAFKHGRYSKALAGTPLDEMYKAALNNPDLLALNSEIAVLAAKLQHTLNRLNRGDDVEGREVWVTALGQTRELKSFLSQTKPDVDAARAIVSNMELVFEHGLNDFKVWDEWFTGVELLRRLVDTERKHRSELGLNLTVERAMLMINLVAHAAQNVLKPTDAEKLRAEINLLRSTTDPTYKHDALILRRDVTNLQPVSE